MPKKELQKDIKIRLSADQKDAIDRLADRAGLTSSTFARQVLHYFLVENDHIYAKLFPEKSPKVAGSQGRIDVLTRRNTTPNL
jgi:hypothetical protein